MAPKPTVPVATSHPTRATTGVASSITTRPHSINAAAMLPERALGTDHSKRPVPTASARLKAAAKSATVPKSAGA